MKKLILSYVFLLFTFFIFVFPVLAQKNPTLILSSSEISVFNIENQSQSIDLAIINNEDLSDTFSISVSPSYWNKISIDVEKPLVRINPQESVKLKIYFTTVPESELGTKSISISVASITDPKIVSSQNVLVTVKRVSPVFVLDLTTDKFSYDPEEIATITTTITNIGNVPSDEYALQTTITKVGEIIKRFDNFVTSIPEKSKKSFVNNYFFEKYFPPGVYSISSVLKNSLGFTISSKSINFEVNKVPKLPTEYTSKTVSFGFLSVTVEIKIKNEGNAKTPGFYVTESVPSFAKDLFDPEIEPNFVNITDNRVVFGWFIPSLQPKQEATIKYQFRLWHVWLALILIAVTVYLAFKFVFTPTIVKKHKYFGPLTKEKEVLITLEVKNKSMYEVKDLLVRDFVPPIMKVVPKFDTLRPLVKESPAGTELTWKFDSLKSGEERVLTYRIKPVVDVIGTLRLPSASIRFVNRKKERKSALSSSLILRSK